MLTNLKATPTFHYQVFPWDLMYDARHFHTSHHRLDANAYVMNDVMSVVHAMNGHANGNDVYGGRKHGANATDVDVVDC